MIFSDVRESRVLSKSAKCQISGDFDFFNSSLQFPNFSCKIWPKSILQFQYVYLQNKEVCELKIGRPNELKFDPQISIFHARTIEPSDFIEFWITELRKFNRPNFPIFNCGSKLPVIRF